MSSVHGLATSGFFFDVTSWERGIDRGEDGGREGWREEWSGRHIFLSAETQWNVMRIVSLITVKH